MSLIFRQSLMVLPSPLNLSVWWNFGSLLGVALAVQISTGLFLALHYSSHLDAAFLSIIHITQNINQGWLLRNLHANGASLYFLCLYLHLLRNLFFSSYKLYHTWMIGVTILLMSMATAFLGYVLPWGQMSLWGATVITNLLSSLPYVGNSLVPWLWGGGAVEGPTLSRFFAFHFILPFLVTSLVLAHLLYLHQTGSNNPLGLNNHLSKVPFHPYFTFKDILGVIVLLWLLLLLSTLYPYLLSDAENFNPANPMISPIHIKPEWYYLFAYAILRSIPNKLGGVIALATSVLILYLVPFLLLESQTTHRFNPSNQIMFWSFLVSAILLTWIGAQKVEDPYVMTGQLLSVLYFSYFLLTPLLNKAHSWFWPNLSLDNPTS